VHEAELRELAEEFNSFMPVTLCSSGRLFGSDLDDEECSAPSHSIVFYQGCTGIALFPVCRSHSAAAASLLAHMGQDTIAWLPLARQQ
jgi:hypothetical protein